MSTREQLMEQINVMPDEEVIDMLRMWESIMRMTQEQAQLKREAAWENLKKYHKSIHAEDGFDYKKELARYRDEKYANPG